MPSPSTGASSGTSWSADVCNYSAVKRRAPPRISVPAPIIPSANANPLTGVFADAGAERRMREAERKRASIGAARNAVRPFNKNRRTFNVVTNVANAADTVAPVAPARRCVREYDIVSNQWAFTDSADRFNAAAAAELDIIRARTRDNGYSSQRPRTYDIVNHSGEDENDHRRRDATPRHFNIITATYYDTAAEKAYQSAKAVAMSVHGVHKLSRLPLRYKFADGSGGAYNILAHDGDITQ